MGSNKEAAGGLRTHITANGLKLWVNRSGPIGTDSAGRHSPVLMLHCFGSDHRFWDQQMPWLHGLDVVRPDTRGHGRSDNPAGPYQLDALAADVVGIMDALGITQVHLVGASLGGMIAQQVAISFPTRIRSLQLVTTTHTYSDEQRARWGAVADQVQAAGLLSVKDALMERWFSPHARSAELPGYQYMSERFGAWRDDSFVSASAAIREVDFADRLDQIMVPTQVIASAQDPGIPEATSRALASSIRGATIQWTPFAHHLASLEHPELTAWLIRRFIDASERG
jgi:3-oxoadipate enol-lactonase